jgi:hypothetical protein
MAKIEITYEISNHNIKTMEMGDIKEIECIKKMATNVMIKKEETKTMETT